LKDCRNVLRIFTENLTSQKKNGKLRDIAEPLPSLKEIQYWILNEILLKLEVSKYSKAYVKGSSIKQNAKFHRNQRVVLTMDIKDYFDTIKIDEVKTFLNEIGYDYEVVEVLSTVMCLYNCLPQGSPTSPYLSNLITKKIDDELSTLATSYGIRFTRYADDITFSGDFNVGVIINKAREIIGKFGFQINDDKIRAQEQHEQQLVTGIVVNSTKMQVAKKRRKDVRQQMYYIKRFGLENHLSKRKITKSNFLSHLLGVINFILFINPNDSEVLGYKKEIYSIIKEYENLN
jgi:RNA-directed DNA polymerase